VTVGHHAGLLDPHAAAAGDDDFDLDPSVAFREGDEEGVGGTARRGDLTDRVVAAVDEPEPPAGEGEFFGFAFRMQPVADFGDPAGRGDATDRRGRGAPRVARLARFPRGEPHVPFGAEGEALRARETRQRAQAAAEFGDLAGGGDPTYRGPTVRPPGVAAADPPWTENEMTTLRA
jgi:hypothetical protein